jgi:hypothetical protein
MLMASDYRHAYTSGTCYPWGKTVSIWCSLLLMCAMVPVSEDLQCLGIYLVYIIMTPVVSLHSSSQKKKTFCWFVFTRYAWCLFSVNHIEYMLVYILIVVSFYHWGSSHVYNIYVIFFTEKDAGFCIVLLEALISILKDTNSLTWSVWAVGPSLGTSLWCTSLWCW